ncbi:hypothetical protein Cgig2_028179 [Carnegiea gigantea]|uniref:Uncharacterized protein n=1 Tax=Carnegiea gigantea TaxID=171969 RepID=A0A9Q1GTH1_9CARY|nr:hypothetical protein Cgig2_028179 [Carnegiea gigantea]
MYQLHQLIGAKKIRNKARDLRDGYGKDAAIFIKECTMKLQSAFKQHVGSVIRKGDGSPRNEGFVKGSVGGKFLFKEVNGSMEGSVSFVEESCADLGGGGMSASDRDDVANVNNDMIREKVARGRDNLSWRVDDGGIRLQGRYTLAKIGKFNKILEPY